MLRHDPGTIGITLDEAGWVNVDTLLKAFADNGTHLTRDVLDVVVAENNKQRFEFSEDGTKVRARQGHSIPVNLGYEPTAPPDVLYHGTATRFVDSILESGLCKRERHDVHLSVNRDTMIAVGARHGKPAILVVDAKRMHQDGHQFFVTGNRVWLTDSVPAKYITLEAD